MGSCVPLSVPAGDRASALSVHQVRAEQWSSSAQYKRRVGQQPSRQRDWRLNWRCDAAICVAFWEEADTPQYVLPRCPALMGTRHRILETIIPSMEHVRRADVVVALAAA